MKLASATKFNRKSGEAEWRDLLFSLALQSLSPMSRQEHTYYVYIVASRSRVLYCGITNNILRRTEQHREGSIEGFTADYKCTRLVWFERYQYVGNAINREKQIKRWRREKKIALIKQANPHWVDLSEAWRRTTAGPSTSLRSGRDDNSEGHRNTTSLPSGPDNNSESNPRR
jgi:putative endonuclease